jgi:hypothetical protein
MLYDGLDERIDGLSSRVDPTTTSDEGTALLLRWLGLPALDDLPPARRRRFLHEAPELLASRGTYGALVRALEIVTGAPVRVRDHGADPGGWFLPRDDQPRGARLGFDSVAIAQQPPSFRAGRAILGGTPLGVGCVDPALVLARSSALVEIRLELRSDEVKVLRPIVDRILPVFAPAHCRLVIDDSPGAGHDRSPRIGVDLRLYGGDDDDGTGGLLSNAHWRLGGTTEAGVWRLPTSDFPITVLDHTVLKCGPTHLI